MSRGIKGLLTGIFVLAVGFILTVLIMSSIHKTTFVDEIKSWGNTEQQQEVPENENQSEEIQSRVQIDDNVILIK